MASLPSGGDQILLSEEEVGGYWGPGSLTAWAAYWTGGINPQERGDLLVITTLGLSGLASSEQKMACKLLFRGMQTLARNSNPYNHLE